MSRVFSDITVALSSRAAAIALMLTCPPWFGESKVSKRQIQHDPTVADGYVRYVCLGLRRRLVVNVMTCVGLWVKACVRVYPSIHCSNYPRSVWGVGVCAWVGVCVCEGGVLHSLCCSGGAGRSHSQSQFRFSFSWTKRPEELNSGRMKREKLGTVAVVKKWPVKSAPSCCVALTITSMTDFFEERLLGHKSKIWQNFFFCLCSLVPN